MAVSMRDLDGAFQGAGQKDGIEIWRIENFRPVPILKSSHGKFFSGDSYLILKTSALKSGALRHDIHYWLGKDTSQDEAGVAAIKTVELDAALGGRAVQYREVQGHETEKFLSYFKPCIIPQEGGVSSGFKHTEAEEHKTRLWICQGKHIVRVKEVPFARSSLNHDDIFILDTKSKIFQFNGSNSSIQERAKALEVVQYIKDTYHDGKCELAAIDDGKLMADAETGEFWGFFGGFAPLPRKATIDEPKSATVLLTRLFRVEKGQTEPVEAVGLTRELLDTNKCYILDCGVELFIWMGRNTSLGERKSASEAADELLRQIDRPKCQIVRVIEGYEPVMFKSKFESWPQSTVAAVSEDARGKVAALLKRQGFNVKGLLKATPLKEEPQTYIDCTGNLQVWRVNGQENNLLQSADQSKFYSGDCYIFRYSFPVEDNEEFLVGTWFGKQSVEEDRASATEQASKMVESLKFLATQARIHEGHEPIQFFAIFQSFIVFKGGLSEGYKKSLEEKGIADDTYSEDGLALFRIQGTGPENMQALQVEPVASSLNTSYCYILHSGSSTFTWVGNLTTAEDQELVERLLDAIKPNMQSKVLKEGAETELFWQLLNGKSEYPSQKIGKEAESDPHLFSCNYVNGNLQVKEIYNFSQDDLMTEDVVILDCQSDVHVWVGQQVQPKTTTLPLTIGEKFLVLDFLLEKLSLQAPIFVVMEGSEPPFFTRFFNWDNAKSTMRGNSFERKLAILKGGGTTTNDKPKRRTSAVYGGGRSSPAPEKSQRSRSMSFSPERVRVRGRSPAFNALAANFENPNSRNLSTPPPIVRKIYPKSVTPASTNPSSKSGETLIPRSVKENSGAPNSITRENSNGSKNQSPKQKPETIKEEIKEGALEDEDGLLIYPYERVKTSSKDTVTDIDATKRESYLSSEEFKEKFGMSKGAFYKLPKWKQNKLKMVLQLF